MRKRFHNLKRPKIRQDWSKWTLYNLSRQKIPSTIGRTFFQQKWTAKSHSRAYHGEQIREKQWQRMFKTQLPAVVPMNYRELAQDDGSKQSAGRGSGQDEEERSRAKQRTPYPQMTYWPVERRLDTAIFRAMFASSTRQARQFVVHGRVKVNGKKMIYPGYLLNPGDMFQVDVDRVMYATGQRKDQPEPKEEELGVHYDMVEDMAEMVARAIGSDRKPSKRKPGTTEPAEEPSQDNSEAATEASPRATEEDSKNKKLKTKREPKPPPVADAKNALKELLSQTKSLLSDPPKSSTLTAKRKQDLRALRTVLQKTLPRAEQTVPEALESLRTQLADLKVRIAAPQKKPDSFRESPKEPEEPADPALEMLKENFSEASGSLLQEALELAKDNPVDKRLPYRTPWRPRDYMSAFAFIPRYLEVNQNICSAVYLRHPVARPGLAEVPTPFHPETSQLAFTWYLRRR